MFCPKCKCNTLLESEINKCLECVNRNCDFFYSYRKLEPLSKLELNYKPSIIKNIKILPYDEAKKESSKFHKWKNYTYETYAVAKEVSMFDFDNFDNDVAAGTNSNVEKIDPEEIAKFSKVVSRKIEARIKTELYSLFLTGGCD